MLPTGCRVTLSVPTKVPFRWHSTRKDINDTPWYQHPVVEVEREALVKGLPAKFIKQAKHSKTVSARSVIRTRDLLITSEMLYQLLPTKSNIYSRDLLPVPYINEVKALGLDVCVTTAVSELAASGKIDARKPLWAAEIKEDDKKKDDAKKLRSLQLSRSGRGEPCMIIQQYSRAAAKTSTTGFEPVREDPSRFRVYRLNHSAKWTA